MWLKCRANLDGKWQDAFLVQIISRNEREVNYIVAYESYSNDYNSNNGGRALKFHTLNDGYYIELPIITKDAVFDEQLQGLLACV